MTEFISKTWLTQNIADTSARAVIEAAPVVEVDTDLLHDIETSRGRKKSRVEWAIQTALELSEKYGFQQSLIFERLADG